VNKKISYLFGFYSYLMEVKTVANFFWLVSVHKLMEGKFKDIMLKLLSEVEFT
jgi:hypothetical protein